MKFFFFTFLNIAFAATTKGTILTNAACQQLEMAYQRASKEDIPSEFKRVPADHFHWPNGNGPLAHGGVELDADYSATLDGFIEKALNEYNESNARAPLGWRRGAPSLKRGDSVGVRALPTKHYFRYVRIFLENVYEESLKIIRDRLGIFSKVEETSTVSEISASLHAVRVDLRMSRSVEEKLKRLEHASDLRLQYMLFCRRPGQAHAKSKGASDYGHELAAHEVLYLQPLIERLKFDVVDLVMELKILKFQLELRNREEKLAWRKRQLVAGAGVSVPTAEEDENDSSSGEESAEEVPESSEQVEKVLEMAQQELAQLQNWAAKERHAKMQKFLERAIALSRAVLGGDPTEAEEDSASEGGHLHPDRVLHRIMRILHSVQERLEQKLAHRQSIRERKKSAAQRLLEIQNRIALDDAVKQATQKKKNLWNRFRKRFEAVLTKIGSDPDVKYALVPFYAQLSRRRFASLREGVVSHRRRSREVIVRDYDRSIFPHMHLHMRRTVRRMCKCMWGKMLLS